MKALIQRVSSASVSVGGEVVGQINQGLLVFLGVEKNDSEDTVAKMAHKILHYRVFADDNNKMNRNVQDIKGGVLLVSQFTLAADTDKGLRPSFSSAAEPGRAEQYYELCAKKLAEQLACVETGQFAADMQVALVNDGPVTFLLNA